MTTTPDRLELALDCVTDGRPSHVPRSLPTEEFTAEAFRAEAAEAARNARPWTVGDGIQGVGIGEKTSRGRPTGDLALRVYVDHKKPLATLDDNPVPEAVRIGDVQGVTTDVIAIGTVEPELFAERARPCMPRCGIGHLRVTAGTLGAIVRRAGDDALLALSNAHVLADDGRAQRGDQVLQPAVEDGGGEGDVVAHLEDFVPFQFGGDGFPNLVDAAIAPARGRRRRARHPPVGPSARRCDDQPAPRHARAQGRQTTDLTIGIITDVHLRLTMRYRRVSDDRVGFPRPGPVHQVHGERRLGCAGAQLVEPGRRPALRRLAVGERVQSHRPRARRAERRAGHRRDDLTQRDRVCTATTGGSIRGDTPAGPARPPTGTPRVRPPTRTWSGSARSRSTRRPQAPTTGTRSPCTSPQGPQRPAPHRRAPSRLRRGLDGRNDDLGPRGRGRGRRVRRRGG